MKTLDFITKKILEGKYIQNKDIISQIARELKCSYYTIRAKLIKYNIKIRNVSEARKLPNASCHNLERDKTHYCKISNCINSICYEIWKNGSRMCGSCAKKGNIPWNKNKKGLQKSGFKGKKHSIKTRKILSIKAKERFKNPRNHPRFGKTSHGKWGKYKGIYMRSSYETKFAQFLDLSGYKWEYESTTFDLGNSTYTPDFYISEWDLYIEIKGWWRDDAKEKYSRFKKLYPKQTIKLLMKEELKEIGVI